MPLVFSTKSCSYALAFKLFMNTFLTICYTFGRCHAKHVPRGYSLTKPKQTQIVNYERKSQKASKIAFLRSDYFTTRLAFFFFFLRYFLIFS